MTEPLDLDPMAALRSAGVQVEVTPETVETPAWTPETGDLEPIVTPERVRFRPDLAALPDIVKSPDGPWLDYEAAFAVLWQAFHALEIRAVTGSFTLTAAPEFTGGSVWPAGFTLERPVTWLAAAPRTPTGVLVRAEAGILGAGKTVAVPKAGTVTSTGATLQVTNVSGSSVVVNSSNPITYIAQALYLHTPPLTLP